MVNYKLAEVIYLKLKVDIDMAICYLYLGRTLSKLKSCAKAKNYLAMADELFGKVGYSIQHPFRTEVKELKKML